MKGNDFCTGSATQSHFSSFGDGDGPQKDRMHFIQSVLPKNILPAFSLLEIGVTGGECFCSPSPQCGGGGKKRLGGKRGMGWRQRTMSEDVSWFRQNPAFLPSPCPPTIFFLLLGSWAQRAKDPIFSLRPRPNERASEEGGMIHSPRPANLSSYMH